MKRKIKLLFMLVLTLGLVFIVGCYDNPGEDKNGAKVEIEDSIEVGLKKEVDVVYTVKNGTEASNEFSISDTTIATVDEFGTIKGKAEGETTLTITVNLLDGTVIKKEVTVKVVDQATYKITFQLAGGSCEVEYGEVKAGGSYTLPTPTKENADFLGWSMSGVEGYITEVKDVKQNCVVRANWKNYYTVSFDLDGGSYAEGTSKVVADGTKLELGTPTKSGYNFLGWSLVKNATSFVSTLPNVNSNCTVYAIWEPRQMKIIFKIDGGVYNGRKYVTYGGTLNLDTPQRVGYDFVGWTLEQDSTDYINKIENVIFDTTVYAHWEANSSKKECIVTNLPEKGIPYLDTLQLSWKFFPKGTASKTVTFTSSDPSILSVTNEGLITTHKTGVVTLTLKINDNDFPDQTMEVIVYAPGKFEVSYETNSYVTVGEEIKLNAKYINENNNELALSWKSLNTDIATVDTEGKVTGVKAGLATIRASVFNDENIYFDFPVTVVDKNISGVMQLVLDAHESNVFTRYNLNIGGTYNTDIIGSVSKILYTEGFEVNRTWEATQAKLSSNHGGTKTSTEFITVHYTGNMSPGADGNANARYFAQGGSNTSIHYTTGNDGIYHILDDSLVGYHAGDGHDDDDFYWRPTGVMVQEGDPEYPVWGISSNSKFTINGRETNQDVPTGTKKGTEKVTGDTFKDASGREQPCINKMGLAWDIIDGEYYMGTTWWCYTQISSGRIGNKGGNFNSIGIESCVNQGSDIWYTWHKTAKLVAHLMRDNNLDIYRVVGHHFYTAKNCPQPMLENDLECWWEFIDLVKAEYEMLTKYSDYEFKYEVLDGASTNTERVTQDAKAKVITYKVTITKGSEKQEVVLASAINGIYSR